MSAAPYYLCIKNRGYPAALEVGKVYRAPAARRGDRLAEEDGLVRVLDESGEDYLYPSEYFIAITLPMPAVRALAQARRRRSVARPTARRR